MCSRGRDGDCSAPCTDPGGYDGVRLPPQVMTSNRTSGSGCQMRADGSQKSINRFMRHHVSRSTWLRRRSARNQYQPTW